MKLHGLVVGRNEEHRYLRAMLSAFLPLVDDAFFFDDRSTDDTAGIADDFGCQVAKRGAGTPAFLEHEGRFRQESWDAFEFAMEPELGDWVLTLDCDEILVGPHLVDSLRYEVPRAAEEAGAVAALLPIGEVFSVVGGQPQVRTDGFWGTIAAPRLFAYHPDGRFKDVELGCGSTPTYVTDGLHYTSHEVSVLHHGYLHETDRQEKYLRYTARGGHATSHIQSIVQTPVLEPWDRPGRLHARLLSREQPN